MPYVTYPAFCSGFKEWSTRPFQTIVILVEGDTVIFKAGTRAKRDSGVRSADYRPGKERIDPETGKSLGRRQSKIGEIRLSSHQNDHISEGNITDGSGFKRGDVLKVVR